MYYPNSIAGFHIGAILGCGHISPNPGPALNCKIESCSVCQWTVYRNHRAIQYELCLCWCHIKWPRWCQFASLNVNFQLTCPACVALLQIFPLVDFSSLSSDFNLPMDIDSSILNVSTDNFDILSTHSTLNSTSPSLQTTAIPNICRRTTGLKGMVINCNGLKGTYHCTEFQALLDFHKPDIVLGCNSKLHKAVPTYSVFPPYYTVFRKDCDCHGVGVTIWNRRQGKVHLCMSEWNHLVYN